MYVVTPGQVICHFTSFVLRHDVWAKLIRTLDYDKDNHLNYSAQC